MDACVVFGSDHAGLALKKILAAHAAAAGLEVLDVGCDAPQSCDYPLFAAKLCDVVLERNCLGVLICGTGIGMSMAANRRQGIRAAVCANEYMARLTRAHNNANVLCLGERWIGAGLAESVLDVFLNTAYEGGRHQRRLDLFDSIPTL